MSQPHPCSNCGRSNLSTATFCAACGTRLASAGKGWKLLVAALVIFVVGLLWAVAGYRVTTTPTTMQPQALSTQIAANTNLQQLPTTLELTSAQHLTEARRALADGYKPNKDPKKASWGEVAAARWHLKAIGSGTPEFGEAQELLKEVARREKQIELASKQPVLQTAPVPAAANVDEAEDAEEDGLSYTANTSPKPSTSPVVRQPAQSTASERTSAPTQPGGTSSDDYYTNTYGERVRRPTFSNDGPPAGASAQCRDGSYSFSRSRRGTCSHHGGVARWL